MFFSGKKTDPKAKRPPPPLGFTVGSLFNPNIGATLRPLGETGKMLVSIIALLFAANGLFPRNHPALLDVPGARLTMGEVIGTAWQNVRLTREKLPQALIFFAVLLSLGCSVLAVITAAMHLFIGTAHAQGFPTGAAMFVSPAGNQDIACGWINWLFGTDMGGGCDVWNYLPNGQNVSNMQSSSIQMAFVQALGFYSDVILVIAAVILFYHLTSMVVETAHHGVVMGRRANQIWAPIRLVVAVGLLVPIAGELNAGQYIVIQIAQWGSAVGSVAWGVFLNALANDPYNNLVAPLAPKARRAVADVVLTQACMNLYNAMATPANGPPNPNAPQIAVSCTQQPDLTTKCTYQPQNPNGAPGVPAESVDRDLCGYYIKPANALTGNAGGSIATAPASAEAGLATAIQVAGQSAFEQNLIPEAQTFANATAVYFLPGAYQMNGQPGQGGSPLASAPVQAAEFENLLLTYEGNLQQSLTGVTNYLQQAMQAVAAAAQQLGWVGAGAWFGTIARIQGDVSDMAQDMPYKTAPPQVIKAMQEDTLKMGTDERKLAEMLTPYSQWLAKESNPNINGNTGLTAQQQQVELAEAGMIGDDGANKNDSILDKIFQAVDLVAAQNGVWQPAVDQCNNGSCFTLGAQFTGNNPLAEISQFGHANLNTAFSLFGQYFTVLGAAGVSKDFSALANVGGSIPLLSPFARLLGATGAISGELAAGIGSVVGMLVVVFFTAGFLLAFFLPLIPFYRFMFGTLAWFLSLLEAVVAVPLVALAHLTPEGEGFMGDKAKTAYYFIFNLFLKPLLMVFGLICGYLIFCIVASLMNLLYITAVAGAGGIGQGHYALARLVYSLIYVVILYLSCNKCFQLIDWLPDHAMKWMGGQGLHTAPMGDPNEVGQYMAVGSSLLENKLVQGTGQLMGSSAGGLVLGAANLPESPWRKGVQQSLKEMPAGAGAALSPIVNTATTGAGVLKEGGAAVAKALNETRGLSGVERGAAIFNALKPAIAKADNSGGNSGGTQGGNLPTPPKPPDSGGA